MQFGLPGLLRNILLLAPPRVTVRDICETTLRLIESYSLPATSPSSKPSPSPETFKDSEASCPIVLCTWREGHCRRRASLWLACTRL